MDLDVEVDSEFVQFLSPPCWWSLMDGTSCSNKASLLARVWPQNKNAGFGHINKVIVGGRVWNHSSGTGWNISHNSELVTCLRMQRCKRLWYRSHIQGRSPHTLSFMRLTSKQTFVQIDFFVNVTLSWFKCMPIFGQKSTQSLCTWSSQGVAVCPLCLSSISPSNSPKCSKTNKMNLVEILQILSCDFVGFFSSKSLGKYFSFFDWGNLFGNQFSCCCVQQFLG